MKVLHIMDQDIINGVPNGGQQVAKKNHSILKKIFGEKNTYLLMFTKNICSESNDRVFTLPVVTNSFENFLISFLGYRRFSPVNKSKIKTILDTVNPDIIFMDSSELGKITKWIKKDIKCIVHFHNIEFDYVWKNKIKRKRFYGFPILFATYFNERLSVKRADKIICLNERDNKRLEKIYKYKADLILPVSFEDKFKAEVIHRKMDERKLLFIGSNFPPNYHGIKWFVQNVMPKLSDFELLIVGKGFENKREELETTNVKVIGTVDNLEEYYYSYCSVVMPILYGDGMKVKTAEAMMYGMNIFATSEALEGYCVENIDGIYRCENEEDFVKSIKNAYQNQLIHECAEEVRKSFLDNNRFESQIKMVKEMMKLE